jgi:hypothetical protein
MKFTVTGSITSTDPITFGFNPWGFISFSISVSAPGFDLFRQTTEINFGVPCKSDKATGLLGWLSGN